MSHFWIYLIKTVPKHGIRRKIEMKRTIALLLALMCIAVFMVGCSNNNEPAATATPEATTEATPVVENTPDTTPDAPVETPDEGGAEETTEAGE